jgi:hypothetical protein
MYSHWTREQTRTVDRSYPSADELRAAGVPPWAPRSTQPSDGIFYLWNVGPVLADHLFITDTADRPRTIRRLLEAIDETIERSPSTSPRPTDFDQPVAIIIVRSGLSDGAGRGVGHGPLSRPTEDLRPLRDLLSHATQDLRRLLSDNSP